MWTKINNVNIREGKLRKVCYRNIDRDLVCLDGTRGVIKRYL